MEDSIKVLESRYLEYLDSLSLMTLRQLCRRLHVEPAIRIKNKSDLIAGAVEVLLGKKEPLPNSGRGAPVKLTYFDPSVIPHLIEIHDEFVAEYKADVPEVHSLVHFDDDSNDDDPLPAANSDTSRKSSKSSHKPSSKSSSKSSHRPSSKSSSKSTAKSTSRPSSDSSSDSSSNPSSNPSPNPSSNPPVSSLFEQEETQKSVSAPREEGRQYVMHSSANCDTSGKSNGEPIFSGILEIMANGYGFLRARNCQPTNGEDVFLPAQLIHNFRLRQGDYITCTAHPNNKNDSAAIDELLTVNDVKMSKYNAQRPFFDALTASYPNEKIVLSEWDSNLSLRVLDLFIPIGKGQRALIIAPPKAGKTTLLKDIARSIAYKGDIKLIVLLIDERPEEVTDFRSNVENAEVIYSTFDESPDHHIRAAELTIAYAKRMAEQGMDVVILLDSLTKLTRAYNYNADTGKTLSGGLDSSALSEPKRFFGAARNTFEQGSITILATALIETGSRMDDVIYEEFKGTGNADIFLSRDLAERRIFPAVDIHRSGTRKEELLLSESERAAVYKLRERGLTENSEGVLEMLKKTATNEEFIDRLSEWIKVYKAR